MGCLVEATERVLPLSLGHVAAGEDEGAVLSQMPLQEADSLDELGEDDQLVTGIDHGVGHILQVLELAARSRRGVEVAYLLQASDEGEDMGESDLSFPRAFEDHCAARIPRLGVGTALAGGQLEYPVNHALRRQLRQHLGFRLRRK